MIDSILFNDNFPLYLIGFIILAVVVLVGMILFGYALFPPTDSGLVAEYVHYELGPDKIRVGVIWYWLPDDLIDENVLGEQVDVWYRFEGQERVITKIEVLN